MTGTDPVPVLDPRFSGENAAATPWKTGAEELERAEIYWLTTVRPDGRPHVTPLIAIWQEGALYFCTGESERKAKNLAQNAHCILTTGCNSIQDGLDVVVEGQAVRVTDAARLQRVADAYVAKYGWHFTVRDGQLDGGDGGLALLFEVRPVTAFGFGKGEPFSQTRWRF